MQIKEIFDQVMTYQFTEEEIQQQKEKVFSEIPALDLIAPCKIDEGILRLSEEEKKRYVELYSRENLSICFFIPASGSGSRMFQFLYEFLEEPTDENRSQVERFLNLISEFAFFKQIPKKMQRLIQDQSIDFEEIVSYLLNKEGLGYGHLPKGLIPFHSNDLFILNPFQEQILQGSQLNNDNFSFHFTIQSSFEDEIHRGIKNIEGITGSQFNVSYSEQSVASNSIAFNDEGEICCKNEGELLTRPAGHGALLPQLNSISEELIFIKNIDNVQHFKNSSETTEIWKEIGGMLIDFKNKSKELFENPSVEGLIDLNKDFQVYSEVEIENCTSLNEIRKMLNRPSRVCGMVKNEGQAGGGPFWIKDGNSVSKQIIEKAQISKKGDQYKVMLQSTHFNPVMIALSPISLEGAKFDLEEFGAKDNYFIVKKKHHGQNIRYIELPGLWNGGMAHWNTIFVEIPLHVFSPVKTVLDLLDDAHKA